MRFSEIGVDPLKLRRGGGKEELNAKTGRVSFARVETTSTDLFIYNELHSSSSS